MKKRIIILKVLFFVVSILGIVIGVIQDIPVVIGLFSGIILGGFYQMISKSSTIAIIDEDAIKKYLKKEE